MIAGSRLVAAIEGVWAEIQARHPDTPNAVIVTGSGVQSRRTLHGSFCADLWHTPDGATLHEVFLAGERFNDGIEGALATLLHEASHAIAQVRGVKDLSRQGRYHNTKFRGLAWGLGLKVERQGSHGWADTTLDDPSIVDTYASTAALADALKIARRGMLRGSRNTVPPLECECGRKIRASKSTVAQAAIICGGCGSVFAEVGLAS